MATKTKDSALKMWKGKLGKDAVTAYSCGIVDRAINEGRGIEIVNEAEQTTSIIPPKKVRRTHRVNFFGEYITQQEPDGEPKGKYIDSSAWVDDSTVQGAHLVNPFLANERCNASIIEAFHKATGINNLKKLQAIARRTIYDGEHLDWQGRRNAQDALEVSPLFTWDQLWDLAREINSNLPRRLADVQSHKRGVIEHLPPKEKFRQNIDVIRRGRQSYNPVTGDLRSKGGKTPYALPLEQAGFAIDMLYQTDGFVIEKDANGNEYVVETAQYYFRLAYGRRVPWVVYKRDWQGCSHNDRIAFTSDVVRKQVIDAHKKCRKANVA